MSKGGSLFDYGESGYETPDSKVKKEKTKQIKRKPVSCVKAVSEPHNTSDIVEAVSEPHNDKVKVSAEPVISFYDDELDTRVVCGNTPYISDKFVDIPNEEPNVINVDGMSLKDLAAKSNRIEIKGVGIAPEYEKLVDIPLIIEFDNKQYKVKDFDSTDWIRSMKHAFAKYHKLYMLLIYLASTRGMFNFTSIDVGYYIKENKLEDLLIEV